MKAAVAIIVLIAGLGCVAPTPLPQWNAPSAPLEAEYAPFFIAGTASLNGQAFLTQQSGGVVKAAGRTVTLDPATTIGNEWWGKSGKLWVHRALVPPSPGFLKARKTAVADADGKFKFINLTPGKYYVRTEVTWEVGGYNPTQGGLVGQQVEIGNGESAEVVLNHFPQ